MRPWLGWVIAAMSLTACVESLAPDVGPLIPACVPEDSDPETAVRFQTDVLDGILTRRCSKCHTPQGNTPIGISIGGLELSSYATLRAGGTNSGADIVIDGDPCRSVISQKLGDAPPFGDRMPRGGPYLDAAEQRTIADWIAEGAVDN